MASTEALPIQDGISSALSNLFNGINLMSDKIEAGKGALSFADSTALVNIVANPQEAGFKNAYEKVSAITQLGKKGQDDKGNVSTQAATDAPTAAAITGPSEETNLAYATLAANINMTGAALNTIVLSSGSAMTAIYALTTPVQSAISIFDSFKLLLSELGSGIVPTFDSALQGVNTAFMNMLVYVNGVLTSISTMFNCLLAGNPIISEFNKLIQSSTKAVFDLNYAVLAKVIIDSISIGVTIIMAIAQEMLNDIMLANPLAWVGKILNGICDIIEKIVSKFDLVTKGLEFVGDIFGKSSEIEGKVSAKTGKASSISNSAEQKVNTGTFPDFSGGIKGFEAASYTPPFKPGAEGAMSGMSSPQSAATSGMLAMPGSNAMTPPAMGDYGQYTGGEKSREQLPKQQDISFSPRNMQNPAMPDMGAAGGMIFTSPGSNTMGMPGSSSMAIPGSNGMGMPVMGMPGIEATTMPQMADTGEYASAGGKNISMQKFCDSIVIQIDKANDKGYNQIQQEVEAQLKRMLDEYDA